MKITFIEPAVPESGIFVLGVSSKKLNGFQSQIDKLTAGQVTRVVNADDFKFDRGSVVSVPYPQGLNVSCLMIVAMNDEKELTTLCLEKMGAKIWSSFGKSQTKEASIYVPALSVNKKEQPDAGAYVANGLMLKSWSFEKYHTKKKQSDLCAVKNISMMVDDCKQAKNSYSDLKAITQGVFLTRDLVTEPANVVYPESLAAEAEALKDMGVKVEVLGKKEMKALGMNALLGVGLGSARESQLIVMQWNGGEKSDAPVALVGKGVTFDTGGISIKPSLDMDEMKGDMAGAGALVGLMKALAGRKAKANVVCVVGAVENMPDGKAQRPGDVVESMSGQTIEILNTDAEGRLVLADALWYTQERFKPKMMVDIATLTGAIRVSLGMHYSGIFSNCDELVDGLIKAGLKTGEKLWRLPMGDAYDKEIDSKIADVQNIGSVGGGGSITAAQFLQRFVGKTKWAHIDIASTAWDKKGKDLSQPGATAIGVRLFNEWIQENYG